MTQRFNLSSIPAESHGPAEDTHRSPKMPWGKYKGQDLLDIPVSYLMWLEEECELSPEFRKEVQWAIDWQHGDVTSRGRDVR